MTCLGYEEAIVMKHYSSDIMKDDKRQIEVIFLSWMKQILLRNEGGTAMRNYCTKYNMSKEWILIWQKRMTAQKVHQTDNFRWNDSKKQMEVRN